MIALSEKISNQNLLTKEGCKNTKQRQVILDILVNSKCPLTAEDIFLAVKASNSSVCLSTIYRNLELLRSKGLITKCVLEDGKARYELLDTSHQHYLVCLKCSKVVNIDKCPFESIKSSIINETEFDISSHKLEIYGLCPLCKK